jgi:protein-tyrosine phosphatase
MQKIKVLFVCMGNICRSPTAEGVFVSLLNERGLADQFEVDSAGTHAYHVGEGPDLRAQKAARDRGIELKHIRSRKISSEDFENFDHVLVMDSDNYADVLGVCPEDQKQKVQHFLDYAPQFNTLEVPDPYYGGSYGFERVLDMVEAASEGFLEMLEQQGLLNN